MVYNALKLFMEINPDLFDEAMQQYKQRKIEYVRKLSPFPLSKYIIQRTTTRSRALFCLAKNARKSFGKRRRQVTPGLR